MRQLRDNIFHSTIRNRRIETDARRLSKWNAQQKNNARSEVHLLRVLHATSSLRVIDWSFIRSSLFVSSLKIAVALYIRYDLTVLGKDESEKIKTNVSLVLLSSRNIKNLFSKLKFNCFLHWVLITSTLWFFVFPYVQNCEKGIHDHDWWWLDAI